MKDSFLLAITYCVLLPQAPVSQKCPLTLDSSTLKTINKLLQMLSHPNLHPVSDVYMTEHHQVIIVQPLSKEGSLKDIIYKVGVWLQR